MKNIIYTVLSTLLLSSITVAQTTSEVLQLARTQNLGTARYNGLSGAFGALGGDLTAISENPAGSAIFNNSHGSISLSHGGSNFNTTYFGTTTETSESNLNFNQIGGILILKDASNSKSINKISLGINYNKDNDYRNSFIAQGDANNSIANYFVGQANGISASNLSASSFAEFENIYINLGENSQFGLRGQQAFLGFQSNLISESTIGNNTYIPEVTGGNTDQLIEGDSSGYSGKVTLNTAMEINQQFYLGANLNIHDYEYRKNLLISEVNNDPSGAINETFFETRSRTFGNGISLGIGGIAKINNNFRAGLSYQSPTWSTFENEVDQNITTFSGPSNDRQDADPGLIFTYPEYRLRTPGKISGSFAYVFGKQGLLSAQYSRQDFSNTKYSGDFASFSDLNRRIKNTFQAVNTYKIGGEYRFEGWSFRAGASHSSSPYKNSNTEGDTNGFSLGTGYNWGKWKLDIGYNHFETDSNEVPFENDTYSNSANINEKRDNISITLGVNF